MHWRRPHDRGRKPHPDVLTPAEWRVLEQVREGRTNGEIAARLGVSVNTVRTQVSSILAKTGLENRAELAAWRSEPSAASRSALERLRAAVAAPFARVRRAAVARREVSVALSTAACLAVLLVFAAAMPRALGGTPDTGPPAATPRAERTAPPTAGPIPKDVGAFTGVVRLQDPAEVIAASHAVQFKTCAWADDWQRPPPAEMASIFALPRFGDGERPYVPNYALYLASFAHNSMPTAVSGSTQLNAFFGGPPEPERSDDPDCGYRAAVERWRSGEPVFAFRAVGHRVDEMYALDGQLVVRVRPEAGRWEEVLFPFDEDGPVQTYHTVQVVDPSGAQLWEEVGWPGLRVETTAEDGSVMRAVRTVFHRWERRADGSLLYAMVWGPPAVESFALPLGGALVIVPWHAPGLSSTGPQPGRVNVTRDGVAAGEVTWDGGVSPWEALGTLTLEPAPYEVLVEPGNPDWGGVLFLSADVPLPPSPSP